MSGKIIIGVMGPGENASPDENIMAYDLGREIAKQGWITLTGGRSFGIMDASLKGAVEAGGLTIGILPGDNDKNSSEHAQIKIVTSMGSGRNYISVLSSHLIVVLGMASGTASEVALALKSRKKIILLNQDEITIRFFKNLGTYNVLLAKTVAETIQHIKEYVGMNQGVGSTDGQD
ncbi:TIGR00725 family protein [Chryseolinea sp. H1M3-3]|uniref:TIGR00725 family protein n=1 Tax=Chryseolinea sp. H1M3-3 TaxID=3034144 RepID=UPI0023ED6AA3|nr:TIGR00725 family protein [Chryseolinea sp. H1M3-3]